MIFLADNETRFLDSKLKSITEMSLIAAIGRAYCAPVITLTLQDLGPLRNRREGERRERRERKEG